jgi:hypothetical protein
LSDKPDEGPRLRKNNSFLHDKADWMDVME